MAQFIGNGNAVDFTPAADTPAGTVVVYGDRIGVTKRDIVADNLGALHFTGEYDFAKAVGASEAIAEKAVVYWDESEGQITTTSSGNTLAGVATRSAGDDDTTVRVRLNS